MSSSIVSRFEGFNADVAFKAPVRVVSTANITLSGLQEIDGITGAVDDRVLVAGQTVEVDNGIWVAAAGTWSRALDFNGTFDVSGGTVIRVNEGTAFNNTFWTVSGNGTVVVGTDDIAITQVQNPFFGSLFTFSQGSTTTILDDIDMIQTTGYSVAGKGAAFYVADAAVGAAYVTANPYTSFISGNGRGFRLSLEQTITPYMLGAAGWDNPDYATGDSAASAPDDGAALQRFYDFVFSGIKVKADDTGLWGTTTGIIVGPTSAAKQRPINIGGNCTIVAKSAITTLYTQRHCKELYFHGDLTLVGTGSYSYASRTCRNAYLFDGNNVSSGRSGKIAAYFFQNWGIECDIPSGEFSEWFSCPHIFALGCGSGHVDVDPAYSLQSTWSTPVDTGSSGSEDQRTTIMVPTLPPAFIDDKLATYPHAVIYNGRVHQIMSINRGAGTISIYPWRYTADPTSGTLTYVFGGGMVEVGPDANVMNIGALSAIHCGFGRLASSGYPGMFANVTAQACAVGIGVGLAPASSVIGGGVVDFYIEGNTPHPQVYFSRGNEEQSNVEFNILNYHEVSYDDVTALIPHDGTVEANYGLFRYSFPRQFGVWEKGTNDVGRGFADISISTAEQITNWSCDNLLVRLRLFDAEKYNLFGRDARLLIFHGTGTNGAPSGTITINANAIAGKTVNGGATAVYTGMKAPLCLLISANPTTGNFTSQRLGPVSTGITAPTGGATVDAEARTAIAAILTALT